MCFAACKTKLSLGNHHIVITPYSGVNGDGVVGATFERDFLVYDGIVPSPTPTPTLSPSVGKYFDRVVIIVFENENESNVIVDPYFKSLANSGTFLSNFAATSHPSYPNYLAMIGGSTFGITNDTQVTINATSVVDLLEAKGLTWKSYGGGLSRKLLLRR